MNSLIDKIRSINLVPYLFIFYAIGLAGMVIPYTHEIFKALVPLNLLLNVGLLLVYHGNITMRFVFYAFLIFFLGLLIEILGVETGVIFGEYAYGTTLGPKIFHTPLMIGVNWFMLVYITLTISHRFFEVRYFRVLMAAVMMVVYDFALEPAAIALNMWSWGGAVPMQNYIAWLVISFILIYISDHARLVEPKNKIAAPLFYVQILFFIGLDVFLFLK